MTHCTRILLLARVVAVLLVGGVLPASAQPFGAWAVFDGTSGYVEVPHAGALGPTTELTIEAWVNVTLPAVGENCKSIVGKNWLQAWWVGVCNSGTPSQPMLRSYLKGSASERTAGVVPSGEWTHIAVTYGDGVRRHFINGELVDEVASSGPLSTSTSPVRIGSDVSWENSPVGAIDDVRLWNTSRQQSEIRAALNEVQSAQPGLVANWRLDGSGLDSVGGFNGASVGSIAALTFPVTLGCTGSSTILCLNDRFSIRGEWRTLTGEGVAGVVPFQTNDSGLLYFFAPSIWEVQIKVLDACGFNDHWWVYFAATTDQFFRIEVLDQERGVQKIYFNYPGEPARAVTETEAFATCP